MNALDDLLAAHLPPETVAALTAASAPLAIAAGDVLIEPGDAPDGLWVLVTGRLSADKRATAHTPGDRNLLGPGECAGVISTILREPSAATVRALEASTLAHVPARALGPLLAAHPALRAWLLAEAHARVIRLALRRAPVLPDEVPDELLDAVSARCDWLELAGGDTLFEAGQPGDALYLVDAGRLRVSAPRPDGAARVLAEVGPGGVVGEMALLSDRPRTATVTAARDTRLVRLPASTFELLVARWPQVLRPMSRLLVDRITAGQAASHKPPRVGTVAVLAVGGWPGARAVAEAVTARFDDATLLDPERLGITHEAPDDDALDRDVLLERLARLESRHHYVVYDGTGPDTRWRERCVRQADRVLLVAEAGSPPRLAGWEAALFADAALAARVELVLVHPAGATPQGTAAWFEARPVTRHHHVCLTRPDTVGRLARRVGGTWTGVALSGGGIRGLAHLGVLKAFEDAGVPIDVLVGASAGAIAGAPYAAGDAPELILERSVEAARRLNPTRDITMPIYSLTGRKFGRFVEAVVGDGALEDAWRPCTVISADLRRAQVVQHRRGAAARWVRASTAAPAILAPEIDGSRLLVDGGIINNLPADVLAADGAGRIVVSDVGSPSPPPIETGLARFPSPWRTLWQKLNPFLRPPRLPGIGQILGEALTCTAVPQRAAALALADLVIDVPMPDIAMFDVSKMRDAYAAGYETTAAILEAADRGSPG